MSATGSVFFFYAYVTSSNKTITSVFISDNNKRDGDLRKDLQITAYFISTFDSVSYFLLNML